MKTSNKLLLGFVGVLFAGMITCNFILKGEYEKQKNEMIETDEYRTLSKEPFKYIKVFSSQKRNYNTEVSIQQAANYEISSLEEFSKFAKVRFVGDTLLVNFEVIPDSLDLDKPKRITIKCPSVSFIELKDVQAYINEFKLLDLKIELKGSTDLNFYNARIANLIVNEYAYTHCKIVNSTNNEESEEAVNQNHIDHLKLMLNDKSSFEAKNVPFKTLDPVVGDSANLSLSGASLRPLLKNSTR